ncbi:hypothetical protein [Burkholderia cenocepacia]|jgi:hypothetical protein|uniref:hypothetical protein n=1 Tax=Burkholderia cenocepacia TaxID=95486 RepID=UPI0015C53A0F|nr:hypothetical protein [Burkholderia cenocepacia]
MPGTSASVTVVATLLVLLGFRPFVMISLSQIGYFGAVQNLNAPGLGGHRLESAQRFLCVLFGGCCDFVLGALQAGDYHAVEGIPRRVHASGVRGEIG